MAKWSERGSGRCPTHYKNKLWRNPMKTLRYAVQLVAILVALTWSVVPALAGATITDLGTLGGAWSEANGINDGGQIVGASDTPSGEMHAYLWVNGIMTDLGTLGGGVSYAYTINNAGQIVGKSSTANGDTHAFLWQNGVM